MTDSAGNMGAQRALVSCTEGRLTPRVQPRIRSWMQTRVNWRLPGQLGRHREWAVAAAAAGFPSIDTGLAFGLNSNLSQVCQLL
jgi:hypothetical protein